MKVMFLNPPSFDDFDGGAGSRYQATREVRSFWYPTWLCYPAGMLPGSRVLDAPAAGINVDETVAIAKEYDLVVFYTSTPSFKNDVRTAELIKGRRPSAQIAFVGPHVGVLPEESLRASEVIDFVVRGEFDYPIKEVAEGGGLDRVSGVSFRREGKVRHNPDRQVVQDLDALPFVAEVYRRDLKIADYEIPWMLYPYVSIYTGRGCPSRCTFCLWPQTIGGNSYRVRSPENVLEEVKLIKRYFPEVREIFFDDDTFTAHRARSREIAKLLGPLNVSWGFNTKVHVDYDTLKLFKDNGLRVMVVGYESGNQKILDNVKKGATIDQARIFTKDAKKLGLTLHGTFILGLPGETRETIEETIRFACEVDPDTLQVSLASPYPGTVFYDECMENGWFAPGTLVSELGYQSCNVQYPGATAPEIYDGVERFYKRFYFRPGPIVRILKKTLTRKGEAKRVFNEAVSFLKFMTKRKELAGTPH
jgi:hopanoid biosynthesis associated radical SAM protein HpnJ